jgi:glyoxylase-like metal-dependent hydrolase (beta-lactamase superfamily II)
MNWFDVRAIAEDVTALIEPGHFEEVISYLVVGSERAALIDTGFAIGDQSAEVKKLTQLPILVVNTHAHSDHRGENYKYDDIAIHHLEAAKLEELVTAEQLARMAAPQMFTRPFPPGFWPSQWQIFPSKATRLLHDGDKIELGRRTLEVIHTPGHSPGSVCLLDRAQRLLITGDFYYPGPLYAHVATANFEDYVASAQKLAAYEPDVDWLLPAHNATPMPASELGKMARAFASIRDGAAQGALQPDGKIMRYEFGTFAALVKAG